MEETKMNIYGKIQTVKVELQKKDIKMSGENGFTKANYFTLPDFLPAVNELFLENKLHSMITFDDNVATLTITDIENVESQLIYNCPMAESGLKNGTKIQNVGAIQTYVRRYLIVNALDIAESDFDGNDETSPDDEREMLIDMVQEIVDNDTTKKAKLDEWLEFYSKKSIKDFNETELLGVFNKLNTKKEVE
jgi:hypothetical protein